MAQSAVAAELCNSCPLAERSLKNSIIETTSDALESLGSLLPTNNGTSFSSFVFQFLKSSSLTDTLMYYCLQSRWLESLLTSCPFPIGNLHVRQYRISRQGAHSPSHMATSPGHLPRSGRKWPGMPWRSGISRSVVLSFSCQSGVEVHSSYRRCFEKDSLAGMAFQRMKIHSLTWKS